MNKLTILVLCSLLSACGPMGTPGFNSLISISSSAPTCTSGGVTVTSALDVNRSNAIELDTDINVSLATICNGQSDTGVFSNVTILDPCGDALGIVDEVLLRLSNGTVLASFSDNASGVNTRFSLLSPGTYQTTDGSSCVFTLTADGALL